MKFDSIRSGEDVMVGLRTTSRLLGIVTMIAMGIVAFAGPAPAKTAFSPEAENYVESALKLKAKGDVAGATIQLKNAIRLEPGLSQARYELGLLYLDSGDPNSARHELEAVQAAGFNRGKLVIPLGQAYLELGHFGDVLHNFNPDEFTGEVQSNVLALHALAQIGLKHVLVAHELLDRAQRQSPDSPEVLVAAASLARAEGQFRDEAKYLDAGLLKDPENRNLLVLKAQLLSESKDLDGALKILDHVIAVYPAFPPARTSRALINLSQNRIDRAADDTMTVLQQSPNNPLALYLHAFLLSREGSYAEATQVLLSVPGLPAAYPPARYLQAAAAFGDNKLQTAMGNAELYVRSEPDDPAGAKLLAAIALRMGDPTRAIRALEPFAPTLLEDKGLRLQLATAYAAAGRSDDAVKLFQQNLQEDPQNNALRLVLATNQLRSGARDTGIEQLQKVIEAVPNSLQANIALAMTYLQAHRVDKATEVADAMIKANPRQADAFILRGTVAMAANDMTSAENFFKEALSQDAKFIPALVDLARLGESKGDSAGAKAWYRKVLAIDHDNMLALNGLVALALSEKKSDEAAQILEQAIAANPKDIAPRLRLIDLDLSLEQPKLALPVARELVNKWPKEPRGIDALARVELANGDFTNGIGSYRKLVQLQPEDPEVQRLLANTLFVAANTPPTPPSSWNRDYTKEGVAALDQALAVAPDFPEALIDRLNIERLLIGEGAALALAKRFVDERPDSVVRLLVAGDLQVGLGKNDLAANTYRAAFDIAKSAPALERLYKALARQHRDAEGLQLLKSWVAEHPDDYRVRFAMTGAYMKMGQLDDAIKETESLNKVFPDDPLLLNNLAGLYDQRGDSRAFELAQRAFEVAPDTADIVDTLGWLETTKRDAKKGVSLLAKAHELAPDNQPIAYHYAMALKHTGDPAKARQVLKASLEDKGAFMERAKAEALLKELGG